MGCTRCNSNNNNNKRRCKKKFPLLGWHHVMGFWANWKGKKNRSQKCQDWPANDDLNQKKKKCVLRVTELIHILQASIGANDCGRKLVNGEKKKEKKNMKDAHRTVIIMNTKQTEIGQCVTSPAFAAKYKFYKTENGQKSCGNNLNGNYTCNSALHASAQRCASTPNCMNVCGRGKWAHKNGKPFM